MDKIQNLSKSCMTLRTLNYGNYGIFLIMGNAGFCPSTVGPFGLTLNQQKGGEERFAELFARATSFDSADSTKDRRPWRQKGFRV